MNKFITFRAARKYAQAKANRSGKTQWVLKHDFEDLWWYQDNRNSIFGEEITKVEPKLKG